MQADGVCGREQGERLDLSLTLAFLDAYAPQYLNSKTGVMISQMF